MWNVTSRFMALGTSAMIVLASVLPAHAADPLPAGYERMLYASEQFKHHLKASPDWVSSYSGVAFSSGGTPGHRIVDLEISGFNFKPSTDKKPTSPDHVLSFIEVPNEGNLKSDNWGVVIGETNFYYYIHKMNWRPIDLELYYRTDPFSGLVVPTYAYVAVENSGKDASEWSWIPPTGYQGFMNALTNKSGEGWRPYDIEFGVDKNGALVGTALLAPREGVSAATIVPTMWKWFTPAETPALTNEGWQLLDVEKLPDEYDESSNPFGSQGLAKYHDKSYRFGIFVNTSYVQTEDVGSTLKLNLSQGNLDETSKKTKGRLIDLEHVTKAHSVTPNGGVNPIKQAVVDHYDGLWLIKD